jgi:catechol 2,3-dioxygenase-like lactoylglutathione lyase family enzyme
LAGGSDTVVAMAPVIVFKNPLVFVSDLDESLRFYRNLLQAEPIEHDQYFALFECGFALHDGDALLTSIYSRHPGPTGDVWGRDNLALYFESDDLDGDHRRLAAEYELIHPLRTEPWGGRVFRIHDPDRHVVEVGEDSPKA